MSNNSLEIQVLFRQCEDQGKIEYSMLYKQLLREWIKCFSECKQFIDNAKTFKEVTQEVPRQLNARLRHFAKMMTLETANADSRILDPIYEYVKEMHQMEFAELRAFNTVHYLKNKRSYSLISVSISFVGVAFVYGITNVKLHDTAAIIICIFLFLTGFWILNVWCISCLKPSKYWSNRLDCFGHRNSIPVAPDGRQSALTSSLRDATGDAARASIGHIAVSLNQSVNVGSFAPSARMLAISAGFALAAGVWSRYKGKREARKVLTDQINEISTETTKQIDDFYSEKVKSLPSMIELEFDFITGQCTKAIASFRAAHNL